MRRKSATSLADARLACERILERTGATNRERFLFDWAEQSVVSYQLIVLGEALSRLREDERPIFDLVAGGSNAVSLRHFLAHGYDRIDPEEIWDTIRGDLPELRDVLDSLLERAEREGL